MQETVRKNVPRMVRKQVFITTAQNRQLKQLARSSGRSEADIIRAAVDKALGGEETAGDWKSRLLSFAGSLQDADGLEQTIEDNRTKWQSRGDNLRRQMAGDD